MVYASSTKKTTFIASRFVMVLHEANLYSTVLSQQEDYSKEENCQPEINEAINHPIDNSNITTRSVFF
jgi:hypothetical protein